MYFLQKIAFFLTLFLSHNLICANDIEDGKNLVGNGMYSEIYNFIGEEILERNKKMLSPYEIEELQKIEAQNYLSPRSDYKPLRAELVEGDMHFLLTALCSYNSRCYNITLYNKQGVGIASSLIDKNIAAKKIQNRDMQFIIGILNNDILSKFNFKQNLSKNQNGEFIEYLKAVSYKKNGNQHYFVFSKDHDDKDIIGYISFILGRPKNKL